MARARAAASNQEQPPVVEELHFRSDNAFLCLLLNRRTRTIRVIDFRAGALPAKRLFIQSVAQREGMEKVVILVEKDEVSSWTRVGFVREGTVPGFYKRSDGHLVGCVIGDKTASVEVSDGVQKATERTINAAKKKAKDIPDNIRTATVKTTTERAAQIARDAAWRKADGALGCFDNFGRDAERIYFESAPRKGRSNFLSAEFQDCFGHSLVEVLRIPKTDPELAIVVAGLKHVNEELKQRDIVSAFAFAPHNDVALSTAFVAAGYRKTGLLAQGVTSGAERQDAILWTRKLADPSGGDPGDEYDD